MRNTNILIKKSSVYKRLKDLRDFNKPPVINVPWNKILILLIIFIYFNSKRSTQTLFLNKNWQWTLVDSSFFSPEPQKQHKNYVKENDKNKWNKKCRNKFSFYFYSAEATFLPVMMVVCLLSFNTSCVSMFYSKCKVSHSISSSLWVALICLPAYCWKKKQERSEGGVDVFLGRSLVFHVVGVWCISRCQSCSWCCVFAVLHWSGLQEIQSDILVKY